MGIELRSIKKIVIPNQFSRYYINITAIDKFSLSKAVTSDNLKAFLEIIKSNILPRHLLYVIHIQKFTSNSLRHLFINITCKRKVLLIKSLKEEFPTFKTDISYWITCANSSIKTLFPYTCKNIFVHFFEKTNLLFRSDNKIRFSAWKMLQTTTI